MLTTINLCEAGVNMKNESRGTLSMLLLRAAEKPT
jgi:hypothetical protein